MSLYDIKYIYNEEFELGEEQILQTDMEQEIVKELDIYNQLQSEEGITGLSKQLNHNFLPKHLVLYLVKKMNFYKWKAANTEDAELRGIFLGQASVAQNIIVNMHKNSCAQIAGKYACPSYPYLDLMNEINLYMIEKLASFKYTRDANFNTYFLSFAEKYVS